MPPRLEIITPPVPAESQVRKDTISLARSLISEGQVLPARPLAGGWTVRALLPEDEGIRLGAVFEQTTFEFGDRIEIESVPRGVRVATTMVRPTAEGTERRTFTSVLTPDSEQHTGAYEKTEKDFFGIRTPYESGAVNGRPLSSVQYELTQMQQLLREPLAEPATRRSFMSRLWNRVFST